MKKFYIYMMSILLMAAGTMTFTSCDDDVLDSMDLSGEWVGNMGTAINIEGYDFFPVSTYIAFYRTSSTRGYGEQIDYFEYGCPYHHQNYYFRWYIRNRTLYMEFPADHLLDIALYDYDFYYSHGMKCISFTIDGVLYGLYKVNDYYNYYGYYYDNYYAPEDWIWWNNGGWYDDGYYNYYTPWGYYSKQREAGNADNPTRGEKVGRVSTQGLEGFSVKRDFSRVKPITSLNTEKEE